MQTTTQEVNTDWKQNIMSVFVNPCLHFFLSNMHFVNSTCHVKIKVINKLHGLQCCHCVHAGVCVWERVCMWCFWCLFQTWMYCHLKTLKSESLGKVFTYYYFKHTNCKKKKYFENSNINNFACLNLFGKNCLWHLIMRLLVVYF